MEPQRPMRIRLTGERRERMIRAIQRQLELQLDLRVGELAAGLLLDFFIRELGAPVYNQAIQDARGFLQDKLVDLEGEFYEPEAERS